MTKVDELVDGLCGVIYRLGVYGYNDEFGDEPIDTLLHDLIDYWETCDKN